MTNLKTHSAFRDSLSAFTLMEVMIAIGILGIGAVLAASLFPAAVREANSASMNAYGEMICATGLAIAKTHDPFSFDESAGIRPFPMGTGEKHYPTSYDPNDTKLGFLKYRLDVKAMGNNFTYYIIVAYEKVSGGDVVTESLDIQGVIETRDESTILNVSAGPKILGSPILFAQGLGGTIIAKDVNNNTNWVQVNRVIRPSDMTFPQNALTVRELGENEFSPVLMFKYYLSD